VASGLAAQSGAPFSEYNPRTSAKLFADISHVARRSGGPRARRKSARGCARRDGGAADSRRRGRVISKIRSSCGRAKKNWPRLLTREEGKALAERKGKAARDRYFVFSAGLRLHDWRDTRFPTIYWKIFSTSHARTARVVELSHLEWRGHSQPGTLAACAHSRRKMRIIKPAARPSRVSLWKIAKAAAEADGPSKRCAQRSRR